MRSFNSEVKKLRHTWLEKGQVENQVDNVREWLSTKSCFQ